MNNTHDTDVTQQSTGADERTRSVLAELADDIAPEDAALLRMARMRAVRRADERASRRRRLPWVAPLATFAISCICAIGLLVLSPREADLDWVADPGAASFVYGEVESELIEDLDFYRWLEQQADAG